jgi:hypothetical protein
MDTCCFAKGNPRPQGVLLVALASLFAATSALAATGKPDLIINRTRLANTIEIQYKSFRASDCAVVEGCVRGTGQRTLLLFDAAIANIGSADLAVGSPVNNPLFEFSPCHDHYHFRGLAAYELATSSGAVVLNGRKQSFCLFDTVPYSPNAPPSSGYHCDNQGLTRGWEDVYSKGLDCQWLDITGVHPSQYQLRVSANLERRIVESDYQNNTASVPIRVFRLAGSLRVGLMFSYSSGRRR